MWKASIRFALTVPALFLSAGALCGADEPGVQKLRFVQDDAQDYMVSKIYTLKYTQANDLMPWVASMIKRYNMNSVRRTNSF